MREMEFHQLYVHAQMLERELIQARKTAELHKTQRDRARYDLDLIAADYTNAVVRLKRVPKLIRRLFKAL